MKEELKSHIKKLQNRATLSLIAILLTIISIVFGFSFLFVQSFISIIFFAVVGISIAYLIYSSRYAKREAMQTIYEPVKFTASRTFSFEEIIGIFEEMTYKENQSSTSSDVRFFRLNKIFKLRTIVYKTENFNKKDFDNAKNLINKKANKELNISPWVNRFDAVKMMRFNIICTDILNDELCRFISQNANHNLTRVEGILNIAIVGNQIIIPPIYGDCDLAEIRRYKGVIKFIKQVLLNN